MLRIRSQTDDMPDIDESLDSADAGSLGLAPGGLMRQKIYEDYFGSAAWDLTKYDLVLFQAGADIHGDNL